MDIFDFIKNMTDPYHYFNEGCCKHCDENEEECNGLICYGRDIIPLSMEMDNKKTAETMDLYGWRHIEEEHRRKISNEVIEAINSARLEHKKDKERVRLYLFAFKMATIPFGKVLRVSRNEKFDDDEIPIKYEGKKVLVKRHHLLKLFTEQENPF